TLPPTSTDRSLPSGMLVAKRSHVLVTIENRRVIGVVHQHAVLGFQQPAEGRLEADPQHVAAAADGVPEHTLIAEPVPDIQPIVADAVAVPSLHAAEMMDVPGRLPLRRLERDVERA